MYNRVTLVNNSVLYIWNLLRVQILIVLTEKKKQKTKVTVWGDEYVI